MTLLLQEANVLVENIRSTKDWASAYALQTLGGGYVVVARYASDAYDRRIESRSDWKQQRWEAAQDDVDGWCEHTCEHDDTCLERADDTCYECATQLCRSHIATTQVLHQGRYLQETRVYCEKCAPVATATAE